MAHRLDELSRDMVTGHVEIHASLADRESSMARVSFWLFVTVDELNSKISLSLQINGKNGTIKPPGGEHLVLFVPLGPGLGMSMRQGHDTTSSVRLGHGHPRSPSARHFM